MVDDIFWGGVTCAVPADSDEASVIKMVGLHGSRAIFFPFYVQEANELKIGVCRHARCSPLT